MKDVHERISFEALLIDKINCALSNKEDVEKITEVNGTGVWVTRDADRVEVEFLDYSIVLLINQDEQIREIELE